MAKSKLRWRQMIAVASTAVAVTGITGQIAMANTLPQKQHQQHQQQQKKQTQQQKQEAALEQKTKQAAQAVADDKAQAVEISENIHEFQSLIKELNGKIAGNQQQVSDMQKQLKVLNHSIQVNQAQLKQNQDNATQLVQAMYEDGQISYLSVLFQATSFSDFLSRLDLLAMISRQENQAIQQTVGLQHTLESQQATQQKTVMALEQTTASLQSMKNVDATLQTQEQSSLAAAHAKLQTDTQKYASFEAQLTPAQVTALEQQVQQGDAILSSDVPGVAEANLQYQNISPIKLFQYVQSQGSTFSLQDIETICAAAKTYDVNPALMVAITGQEQSFVPPGPDAALIRNNPYNVYYSWQVYNTNLADSANIAADTLRHKLSVPPPAGEDPILWINDPANPWGIYAQDKNWAYGVRSIFYSIESFCAG